MRGPCPKCDAIIEMPEQESSANGASQQCPECHQKYWMQRETHMLRAYKKQGRVYCFDCGHELGSENLCVGCGSLCPDYCVVQATKSVVRKQQTAALSFSAARRPRAAAQVITASATVQKTTSKEAHKRPTNVNRLAYVALAVLLLIVAGGVSKVYLDSKADQKYAKNFIVALYGIKSGTDLSLGAIDAVSTQWKKSEGTFNVAPRPSQKDLDRQAAVKAKINEAMDSLSESPEKFANAKKNLLSLHRIYGEIQALNTSVPGSLETLTESTHKLEAEFFKAATLLKSSMPEELLDELRVSVARYRNLDFMMKNS